MIEEDEIWQQIKNYPTYDVSTYGRVRNNTTSMILKQQKNVAGYMRISLIKYFNNGTKKSQSHLVHRLVAQTFIQNLQNKNTVDHIDGVRHNNNVTNLRWATIKEQNTNKNNKREKKFLIFNNTDNEEWKEIPENIIGKREYYVSTIGRIKFKNKIRNVSKSSIGYVRVGINNKLFLLHRLVAQTFIDNPSNKEHVNHKDGNIINNSVNNLEWSTCVENSIHKISNGLSNCTKKIIQYDKFMNKINDFSSIVECSRFTNISVDVISNNCRDLTKITKSGYIFKYLQNSIQEL
jgi:NUMOD4 motif/HNH endonuclease